ncbi:hypothetical protein SAMN06295967_11092 [Belliella buryatensis]|uniref:Uncharacterized protein n=1 Tax=Belliella buryatensis TaxID=1500549 RepID=A0A239ERK9_9BACT|nr:hypothetical protein SAMN06295967_11092 [Belliella buryatensis]
MHSLHQILEWQDLKSLNKKKEAVPTYETVSYNLNQYKTHLNPSQLISAFQTIGAS